ncbi:ThiF family protein [Antricoccus suffuscus]|uniref:ThiF family protein n=1 Tax=Antricoccus suffuscus TaxID=1629062 RepID=A0A2T0ZQC8_9ACTN|nr:hypothetical protein [Antricoccus suffuscus]PRZ38540.1 ThiF family protein [Antricoccus suffuscus]
MRAAASPYNSEGPREARPQLVDPRLAALPAVPWIPPVLRRVWRDVGILQIGIDGDRAIVLGGITPERYRLINSINGRRSSAQLIAQGPWLGLTADDIVAVLRQLHASGVLVDLGAVPAETDSGWHPENDRGLLPDLAARLLSPASGTPQQVAAARAHSQVLIHGGRRVGSVIAGALAAAGLGRINVVERAPVDASDVTGGGFGLDDVGADHSDALARLVKRVSDSASTARLSPLESPDLLILTETWPGPDERERSLQRSGTPYLCATVRERRAVIGPFVVPGESSCLQCQHLSRRDRDPQWPAIYGQLRMQPHRPEDAGESALALLAGSLASIQALQWFDGERLPETINTTLEIGLPDLVLTRRFWPRHPLCTCQRA